MVRKVLVFSRCTAADRGEHARLRFVTGLHRLEEAFGRRDAQRTIGLAVDDAEAFLGKIR